MRDLTFFNKRSDYEDFMWNEIFTEPWVNNTPFYHQLVNWVMDHRAPIFYTISNPSEHFAFSGAYHFETKREKYPNRARECLFWLHDFTHMLFPYSHDVLNTPESQFLKEFWYQERIASNETEIMSYYRVPELREQVFQDEKLYYDVIQERGRYGGLSSQFGRHIGETLEPKRKPDPSEMLLHRKLMCESDAYGATELGDYPDILQFFQKWRDLTPKWVSKRYHSVAGLRIPEYKWDRKFTVENYEERIMRYTDKNRGYQINGSTQDNYERLVMANVHTAFGLLQWEDPPLRWRHVPDAIQQLEGAVFFK